MREQLKEKISENGVSVAQNRTVYVIAIPLTHTFERNVMKSYIQVDVQKKSIASFSFYVNFSRHLPLIRTLDLEVRASILACRVVSHAKTRNFTPHFLFSPRCINGYRDILLGDNPAIDQHPVQGGVVVLLGMLHAKETGITFGHLDLCLAAPLPCRHCQV